MGFWDTIRNSMADNSQYHWDRACEALSLLNQNDPKAVEHLTTGLDRLRQEGRAAGFGCFSFYNARAGCYLRLGRPAEAAADMREAFRVYPDAARQPLHLIARAKALLATGEYEAALADLDEAVRLKPEADEAYQLRADCHLAVGECDRAVEEYSEAIRRHGTEKGQIYVPLDTKRRYHVNRGLAYLKLGETEKAVEDFTTAITLANAGLCSQEMTASAAFNRGWAHLKAGDAGKAVEDFTTAVRLQPGFVAAYEGRSAAYRAAGDAGAADTDDGKVQELKVAAARSPVPASSAMNWGDVGSAILGAAGLVFFASAAVVAIKVATVVGAAVVLGGMAGGGSMSGGGPVTSPPVPPSTGGSPGRRRVVPVTGAVIVEHHDDYIRYFKTCDRCGYRPMPTIPDSLPVSQADAYVTDFLCQRCPGTVQVRFATVPVAG